MKYIDVLLPIPKEGAFTYLVPDEMILTQGMRVTVPFGSRSLTGAVVREHNEKPEGFQVKPVSHVIDTETIFDERLITLSDQIASTYLCSEGEAIHCALPGSANGKSRYTKAFETTEKSFSLTQAQQKICDDIASASQNIHLLHGVTGSGKTEVYMHLALQTIDAGKSVIFLVPEITLSSQLYRRLDSVFGSSLVVYHSGLSANQKADHWKRMYSGEAAIAVGTRSAVFLQGDIGLIIIDEEHDTSYKENSTPRYNTRRVALMRSRNEGCRVILGSATPSLESYYAAEQGHIMLHTLNERFGNAALPVIETVSLDEHEGVLTPRLRSEVVDTVKRKEQVVLMLNRRGYAPVRMCGSCKARVECPDCSVPMTYHSDGFLKCHYCGYILSDVKTCPACASDDMIMVGSGTQRVEESIEEIFPAFSVFRMDRDTARKKDRVSEMIEKLDDGSIDIVVGTQMIAKGFDFHGITLVGVLMADIGMSLPDFRAGERIFSLLMQVAGRCGRGEKSGKVLIQTLDPENPVFSHLKNHDYISFYREECELRKMLNYPPFGRISRIVFRGKDEALVNKSAQKAGEYLKKHIHQPTIQILGPSPAPFAKIAANYRYHIILKHGVTQSVREVLKRIQGSFKTASVYIEIDIDPVDML